MDLAEYNKELRKQKAEDKNKNAVKDVITELAVIKEIRDKDKKKQQQEDRVEDPSNEFNLFAN